MYLCDDDIRRIQMFCLDKYKFSLQNPNPSPNPSGEVKLNGCYNYKWRRRHRHRAVGVWEKKIRKGMMPDGLVADALTINQHSRWHALKLAALAIPPNRFWYAYFFISLIDSFPPGSTKITPQLLHFNRFPLLTDNLEHLFFFTKTVNSIYY